MPLVWITGFADAVVELNASALLDDMRGLVRRSAETGDDAEGHLLTERIRLSADAASGLGRSAPDVSSHAPEVVPRAEGLLDLIQVWQGTGLVSGPVMGKLMYVLRRRTSLQQLLHCVVSGRTL